MTLTKPTAVIVDIDGTLADVTSVRHHVLSRPKDFAAFHSGALMCPPIASTMEWVSERHAAGHEILIVTARMEKWFTETHLWLEQHMTVPFTGPMMRQDGDYRPDFTIKKEILARLSAWYDIVEAIDDNPNVVRLWESHGIPTTVVPGWLEEH